MIEGYLRFLDLGNTATLRKDKVSPRPASLKSRWKNSVEQPYFVSTCSGPLALRCALFDCWSPGGLKRREAFAEVTR